MNLIKLKPGHEFFMDSMLPSHVMNAFDSIFNDSMNKMEREAFFRPRVDVVENEKNYEISVALPGIKKEEIAVDVDGDLLTISGERKRTTEKTESNKFHLTENVYGKFSRSFTLPENVDKGNLSAAFTDGVLKLEIPKVEQKEKTKVAIR